MGTVREVRIAKRTGFCYGVREAVDKAKESADAGKRTQTLGQVVHNEGVIAELGARGVVSIAELSEARPGSTVVIRAHGVTPAVRSAAAERGLEVIDGTCSWVIGEQRQLQGLVEDGYTIVLLGTPNHPEVVGLLGFAPDAIVVDDESDWDRIPRKKRMALITQSTQPPWKFERLAAFMVNRAHELKIINSVCPVTIRRQEDTVELAKSVDFIVVVGGRAVRQHARADPAVRDRRDTRHPGRACGRPERGVGIRRIRRGRRDRRHVDADRGPRGGCRADPDAGRHPRRRGACP